MLRAIYFNTPCSIPFIDFEEKYNTELDNIDLVQPTLIATLKSQNNDGDKFNHKNYIKEYHV